MDLKVLDKVFEQEVGELLIGLSGFHFYRKDEIGEGQIGYRCNADYVKLEDWIGDQYFVIGYETLLGDRVLVNIEDENLPVYSLVKDDWSMCYKVANSIQDYYKILRKIMDSDLTEKQNVDDLILEIENMNASFKNDYWKDFLMGVYEDFSNFPS